jgi:hypothetical protein
MIDLPVQRGIGFCRVSCALRRLGCNSQQEVKEHHIKHAALRVSPRRSEARTSWPNTSTPFFSERALLDPCARLAPRRRRREGCGLRSVPSASSAQPSEHRRSQEERSRQKNGGSAGRSRSPHANAQRAGVQGLASPWRGSRGQRPQAGCGAAPRVGVDGESS